jgi:DNA polymerase I-like protein with 3'-5' exonuclease and polymerase domains
MARKVLSLWDGKTTIAFDTETTGVVFHQPSYLHLHTTNDDIEVNNPVIFGISLAIPYRSRIALFWARNSQLDLHCAVSSLLEKKGPKVAHNARYDLRVCKENGIIVAPEVECTMTMARIFWDRRKKHGLEAITEFLCPELCDLKDATKKELTRLKGKYTRDGFEKDYVNFSFLPDEMMAERSMLDSFMCLMIYRTLQERAQWNSSA